MSHTHAEHLRFHLNHCEANTEKTWVTLRAPPERPTFLHTHKFNLELVPYLASIFRVTPARKLSAGPAHLLVGARTTQRPRRSRCSLEDDSATSEEPHCEPGRRPLTSASASAARPSSPYRQASYDNRLIAIKAAPSLVFFTPRALEAD